METTVGVTAIETEVVLSLGMVATLGSKVPNAQTLLLGEMQSKAASRLYSQMKLLHRVHDAEIKDRNLQMDPF